MKVVSIGTNHAGTSFLRTLAKLDIKKEHEIVTYDMNDNISFLGCGIALWVGGEFTSPEGLFYSNPKELMKMGIKVKMQHKVIEVNQKDKYVVVKNLKTGEEFKDNYDKLVYSAGTWPIVPPFKGIELKNIFMSKIFQHAQLIIKCLEQPHIKDVVVIGAGYIGIELVEAFQKHGKNVTLIDMESRVIPNYFDEEFTKPLEDNIKKVGVKLAMEAKVQKFLGKDGKVTEVVTDKGIHKADMVLMSIGFKPLTDLIDGDKLPNGAIKVNEFQQSHTDKDIYVLGDAASMMHNSVNKHMHVALATNAVKTGVVAAFNIMGTNVPMPGVTGTNAINVFGVHYSSTGVSCVTAEKLGIEVKSQFLLDDDRPRFMHNSEKVGFKIVYDPKTLRLLGAQIGSWGKHPHTEIMHAMSLAIQKQMTLTEIALMDVYFLPHYNKPFNFVLQTILNALGMKYLQ
ncbi:FAD-dependent oxidoreductase [Candidatus Mycoplasma mahonii]|uniref:FAD-dependent oxidoreductase n=1 Tax=Candidatus Mycoplasma mahonii TaxID=3004105 RepID=UPI0026F00237|nr:FAD-dependent oxidoreductase [Candidatus Mycoplasma mahonii]WKX02596.1 FAD-dependent oxidoreductase [Candidatus Mycoplasma mahonii]